MIEKKEPKAKIIGFPQKRTASEETKPKNGILDELKSILTVDAKPVRTKKTAPTMAAVATSTSNSAPISVNINFNGGHNQFAAGDLSITGLVDSLKQTATEIPGKITKAQKRILLELRNDIEGKSAQCGFPRHPGAVMKELNAHIGVTSYHNIPIEDFNNAKGYLESYIKSYDSYLHVITIDKAHRAALWESIKTTQAMIPMGSDVHTKIALAIHQDETTGLKTTELITLLDLAVSTAF